MVSIRVVKTRILCLLSFTAKSINAPSLRPTQSRWRFKTFSGQPSSISLISVTSSSAYLVIRRNHCSISFFTTGVPQRQQVPPDDCSFDSTVSSFGHQLTADLRLYARPRSNILRKNHWSHL